MTAKEILFGEPAHRRLSIASLILTTDCMIAQIPDKKAAMPAAEEMA